MDQNQFEKPKKKRRAPAPPPRIGDVRMTKVALEVLRDMEGGGTLRAVRTFPQDFHFQMHYPTPEEGEPKMPQPLTDAVVDTLVRTKCIVADSPGDRRTYALTDRGRDALAGRGFDVVAEQLPMFGDGQARE